MALEELVARPVHLTDRRSMSTLTASGTQPLWALLSVLSGCAG
jgi:hypothetical protein